MNQLISLLLALSLVLSPCASFAQKPQKPPEIQAIQEKLQRGEKLTETETKQFNDYIKSLDDKLKTSIDKLKQVPARKPVDLSKPLNIAVDNYLPKPHPAAHYGDREAPTQSEYLALAKKYHEASGAKLAPVKSRLDSIFVTTSAATDLSNLGMSIYLGRSKDDDKLSATLYAITAAALKDPANGVTAGNFGVLLKNAGAFADSLRALLYSEKLLPQAAVEQTNLGWTIAYLGDFFTAKSHFQKAINLDVYDAGAYEGLGLLYRVEGNQPEASKYLRLSLRNAFSSVAARNLTLIEGKVDAVIATNPDNLDTEVTAGMRLSDVMAFPYPDNKGGDGGGKLEFAESPDFFSPSVKRVYDGHMKNEFLDFGSKKKAEFRTELEALETARKQLGPLRPPAVRSGNTTIYPRSFEFEAFALVDMDHIFARRLLLREAKFNKRFQNEIHLPQNDKFFALQKQFEDEYRQCARNEPCQDAAKRRVCRLRIDNIKTLNGSFQTLWAKYVQEQRADLQRYFDAATPWLREIKDTHLNRYMNLRRELFIKGADPVEELGVWGVWESDVNNNWSNDCGAEPTKPNNGNYLRNKLKVFAEPYGSCHVPVYNFAAGAGWLSAATEAACDSLKVEFGAFGVIVSAETKFGDKESDDVTTFRTGMGVKEGFSASIGGVDYLNGEVGAKGSLFIKSQNGEVIDHGVEGSAKAEATIGNEGEGVLKGYLPTATIGFSGKGQISIEGGPQVSFNDEPAVDFGGLAEHLQ